jgi:hypothetical protein
MKRNLFAFIIISLFFVSCSVPNDVTTDAKTDTTTTSETTTPTETADTVAIQTTDGVRYVKNSLWKNCSLDYLVAKSSGRAASTEISDADLVAIVETLNDSEDDNQYFIETTDTDISESPTVDVYIVNEAEPTDGTEGWALLGEYLDWDRADYASRPAEFQMQADNLGGLLFIDKIPPKPEAVVDTRTEHEKNQLTIYSYNTGKILYSENCLDIYDGTNFKSLKECYESCYNLYKIGTEGHNVMTIYADDQWVLVAGHYYTEPSEAAE